MRLTLFSAALIVFGLLPAAVYHAAAEPEKPVLSDKEMKERCDAALKDVRTFCGVEAVPRNSSSALEIFDMLPVQAPRAPNPGSERPVLPRSRERFECLNARLRVDRYCYPEGAHKASGSAS